MTSLQKLIKTLIYIAIITAPQLNARESSNIWNQYQALATNIDENIDKASLPDITDKAIKLTQLSTKLLPDFISKQPICAEYIEAAMDASKKMLTLSLEEIERDYHADGKLPPMKQAVCYHAKDLLVHPATIAVIAGQGNDSKDTRKKLAHELEEVLEHFSEVKKNAGL